jgi:coproporphyrinogen III oxidase
VDPQLLDQARSFLFELQERITTAFAREEPRASFQTSVLEGPRGGVARPRVLEGGDVLERAAVNLSHTRGEALPPAATARRPELAGRAYEAVSVSLIAHPKNPFAPTSHANFRFFVATAPDSAPVWWFGGGFDLTPYYGYDEDARHWHATAREACEPFEGLYDDLKARCDAYFFLRHRGEARGIGGLFFDDWDRDGFEAARGLWQRICEHYLPAYLPLLERRKGEPYGERERDFQLWRRGRYVEFNLLQDRGTAFGIQAGGRTESILASLPPEVRWRYDHRPEPGTREAELAERFLVARDWLAEG